MRVRFTKKGCFRRPQSHWNSAQTSCAVSFTNGSCRPSRRARRGARLSDVRLNHPKCVSHETIEAILTCPLGESMMVLPACSLPILSRTGGSCQGSRNFWQASPSAAAYALALALVAAGGAAGAGAGTRLPGSQQNLLRSCLAAETILVCTCIVPQNFMRHCKQNMQDGGQNGWGRALAQLYVHIIKYATCGIYLL